MLYNSGVKLYSAKQKHVTINNPLCTFGEKPKYSLYESADCVGIFLQQFNECKLLIHVYAKKNYLFFLKLIQSHL